MNLINQTIIKIKSSPYFKYSKWLIDVEVEDEGGISKTTIMGNTKVEVLLKAKVGNIIQG